MLERTPQKAASVNSMFWQSRRKSKSRKFRNLKYNIIGVITIVFHNILKQVCRSSSKTPIWISEFVTCGSDSRDGHLANGASSSSLPCISYLSPPCQIGSLQQALLKYVDTSNDMLEIRETMILSSLLCALVVLITGISLKERCCNADCQSILRKYITFLEPHYQRCIVERYSWKGQMIDRVFWLSSLPYLYVDGLDPPIWHLAPLFPWSQLRTNPYKDCDNSPRIYHQHPFPAQMKKKNKIAKNQLIF